MLVMSVSRQCLRLRRGASRLRRRRRRMEPRAEIPHSGSASTLQAGGPPSTGPRLVESPFTAPRPEGWTRFVCFSDTHGLHDQIPAQHRPRADVLLHAGDFTNTGELAQVQGFSKWLKDYPAEHKVVIAGNHDITFHEAYYSRIGGERFHGEPQRRYRCEQVREALTDCIYLEDESITIRGYHIYGSPWQPEFCDWAFNLPDLGACMLQGERPHFGRPPHETPKWRTGKGATIDVCVQQAGDEVIAGMPMQLNLSAPSRSELEGVYTQAKDQALCDLPVWHQENGPCRIFSSSGGGGQWMVDAAQFDLRQKWEGIPAQLDILLTHGPAHGVLDLCSHGGRAGCRELLKAICQRRVPVHLSGHIHEAFGAQFLHHPCEPDDDAASAHDGRCTLFINASTCTLRYRPTHPPVVFDLPPAEKLRAACAY